MNQIFDPAAGKKPTNVSVNSDLLEKARSLNLNFSAVLEEALTEKVVMAQREIWQSENAEAIERYNDYVSSNKTFSDQERKF